MCEFQSSEQFSFQSSLFWIQSAPHVLLLQSSKITSGKSSSTSDLLSQRKEWTGWTGWNGQSSCLRVDLTENHSAHQELERKGWTGLLCFPLHQHSLSWWKGWRDHQELERKGWTDLLCCHHLYHKAKMYRHYFKHKIPGSSAVETVVVSLLSDSDGSGPPVSSSISITFWNQTICKLIIVPRCDSMAMLHDSG